MWLVLIGLLVVLGWSTDVRAEVTVIYRKSDRVVGGWVIPPHSVAVEIDNLTKSELGGAPSDYATVVVPDAVWNTRRDKDVTVTPEGTVVFVPNAKAEKRKAAKAAASAKLAVLGLTTEEIAAMLGD